MARIALDARMAGSVPTGLGTYAEQLTRALVTIDREHSYVVIRGPEYSFPLPPGARVEEVVLPGDLDTPRNLVHGPAISRLGLDLYHSLHHFLPLALRVPRVVLTLHDLIWIEHPRLIIEGGLGAIHRTATHLFGRAAMGQAMRRADRIISVSAHSRDRALGYYRLDPSRIVVVHHGVDHQAFPFGADKKRSPPYFLTLGNTRPYKNMPTALRVFASCARRHADVRLVVAGRGDSIRTLLPLARALGIADRVRFVGPLPHAELIGLLHGATALVFPSIVEGFGFPVLEAMATGCPVVASNIPTVVEVAGDAALLCDPADPDQFAGAMMRLLDDDTVRADLALRGCERAARFSWERCAAETLAVYQQLL